MRRLIVLIAAMAAALGTVAVTNAQAPSLAPSTAVRFPAGYAGQIYVGETKVWPTAPATTTTVQPTTTTALPAGSTTTAAPATTTTTPATSTTATTTAPSTTEAPTSTTSPAGPACGLPSAAFCETFDSAHRVAGTRTGDLDPTIWGVSRTGTIFGYDNPWEPATLNGQKVLPPDDVRVINGQLTEAVSDGTGQTILAMYPKQPFNFDGRTGTIKFDVSNDNQGAHSAWPEFWITDQPVPAPGGPQPTQNPVARNSIGISFARRCTYEQAAGVDRIVTTKNYVQQVYGNDTGTCVANGTPTAMTHVEIQISTTRVQVWQSAGDGPRTLAADMSIPVPLVQGVVWLEDVHYNADKFEHQRDHQFTWDNLGFDGPKTYRDRTFDVPDASPSNLGWELTSTPLNLQVQGVNWDRTPTTAYVTFNLLTRADLNVPQVSINGGPFHTIAWPFDGTSYEWHTFAVPVPVAEVQAGTNTITFKVDGDHPSLANVNLSLINAAPVP